MEIKHTQFKRCDLLKIKGRIDSYTAPQLEEAINEITNAGRFKIVLDMSEVDFVSSRGWWVLIDNQKKCKRFNRGEVVLAGLQQNIRDSLNLVGMGKYFELYDDVINAVGNF